MIILQPFESVKDGSRNARGIHSKYLQFGLTLNDMSRNAESLSKVCNRRRKCIGNVSLRRRINFYKLTIRSCSGLSSMFPSFAILTESRRESEQIRRHFLFTVQVPVRDVGVFDSQETD